MITRCGKDTKPEGAEGAEPAAGGNDAMDDDASAGKEAGGEDGAAATDDKPKAAEGEEGEDGAAATDDKPKAAEGEEGEEARAVREKREKNRQALSSLRASAPQLSALRSPNGAPPQPSAPPGCRASPSPRPPTSEYLLRNAVWA